ncbi:MAG: cell division protein ZapA [Solirubrobacteraceae bacterium]
MSEIDSIKIKVTIGGRNYPLIINRIEEEKVRKVLNELESMIKKMKEDYVGSDIQDILSMCSLQLMLKKEEISIQNEAFSDNYSSKFQKLSQQISNLLEN